MILLRNLIIIVVSAVAAMGAVAAAAGIPFEWVAGTVLIVEIAAGATLAGAAILRRERRPRPQYEPQPRGAVVPYRCDPEIIDPTPPARLALPEPKTMEVQHHGRHVTVLE